MPEFKLTTTIKIPDQFPPGLLKVAMQACACGNEDCCRVQERLQYLKTGYAIGFDKARKEYDKSREYSMGALAPQSVGHLCDDSCAPVVVSSAVISKIPKKVADIAAGKATLQYESVSWISAPYPCPICKFPGSTKTDLDCSVCRGVGTVEHPKDAAAAAFLAEAAEITNWTPAWQFFKTLESGYLRKNTNSGQ